MVKPPPPKADQTRITLPQFDFQPVAFSDEAWTTLEWPDDLNAVASSSVDEEGVHIVYYSTDFPAFKARFDLFARRGPDLAKSFEKRYAIWLVVHSLLYKHEHGDAEASSDNEQAAEERRAEYERSERVRVATLSAMIAAREMQLSEAGIDLDVDEP